MGGAALPSCQKRTRLAAEGTGGGGSPGPISQYRIETNASATDRKTTLSSAFATRSPMLALFQVEFTRDFA